MRAALAAVGWALLGLAALAGVALSAAALFAATDLGRPLVASAIVRIADEAVAGHLTLAGIRVLAGGGVELSGLRVEDPDGHLVLAVDRARVAVDVTRIRSRVVGLRVELDGPSVLLEEEPDGGTSLARAFAPSHPAPPRPEAAGAPRDAGPGWTVRLVRLAIRGGDLWWVDARGATRLEAQGLSVDARGAVGPDVSRAEVRVTGAADVPVSGPLELELRARRQGDAVRLRRLSVRLGDTRLQAIGEGDLGRRTGRLHVARLGVDGAQTRALFPAARLAADLDAEAYAESDGATATAVVHVAAAPDAPGGAGRADAALAVSLDSAVAAGFDVALDRLDPSKVLAGAPEAEVTLAAHGAASGRTLASLRARIDLSLARSRLRGGVAGPAELVLRADRGSWELTRGSLAAPGLAVEASGRWREGGAVSGRVDARAGDLAAASRNLSRLLDRPLPALGGALRAGATLSGTSAAPAVSANVAAPRLALGALSVAGLRAEASTSGPLRAPTVRVDAGADALRSGGGPLAHALLLRATLTNGEAQLSGSAAVPALGRDPVSVQARARLGDRAETLVLDELAIAYPGTRYTLARPATARLAGPSVDHLELVAGPQRLALEGGIGARGALDARLVVERLDLARLPVGAPGARERIAGALGVDLRATGTTARPRVAGRVSLEGAAFRTLVGLRGVGELSWDGGTRRAAASASLARGDGGTVELSMEAPLPLAARPSEPVSLRVRAAGLPLEALLELAAGPPVAGAPRVEPAAAGTIALDATVSGTAGAPALHAAATVEGGRLVDLGGVGLTATADAPGGRLDLHVEAALSGRPAATADVSVPLVTSAVVAGPAQAARALRSAALSGTIRVPGLELADLSGRLGVPEGLRGRLAGEVAIAGTVDAPRGTASADLSDGAFAGYAGIAGRVELEAGAAKVEVRARASHEGAEVLRATGSLAAPLERLATREGLRGAALALDATVPRVALARARLEVPLAGTVEARLTGAGTLAAPRITVDATGSGLAVDGRPLGDATLSARSGGGRVSAEARLVPASGGTLRASLAAELTLGLDLRGPALRAAPAELALRADAVDLGFLPAVAPVVRTASGRLDADVTARGPLGRLSPAGRIRLADGRIAVSEYGDFTGVTVEAAVTDDAVEVTRLAARRGSGSFEASGALRGLRSGSAILKGHVVADGFVLSRAGMELATLTTRLDATGTYHPGDLQVRLDVPRGTLKLPKRTPRTLQPLEPRPDIVVGRRAERRAARRAVPIGEAAAADERPFTLTVRVVSPGHFDVVSDTPRVRVELKADATYELQGSDDYLSGSVEVVRGNVEPIGGRLFDIQRGKVTFTGGPPKAAMLDVEARWENPTAIVTVRVAGPLADPEIKLSSQPPLDEAQIAMLIATGRTELKAGGGAVGTLTGEEAGKAVLGALATQVFKDLVADKLPLDTVALDSGALRAGKYVTDRVYVGYTRRFDARPELGENTNELRVEYQISPRWSLESRYGDAQSGGASLIWSKDY